MLTLCAIIFALIGYRAQILRRTHFIWIAAIAVLGVFFRIEQANKIAAAHGATFNWSFPLALGAWVYSVVYMIAGLVVGLWIGNWNRARTGRSRKN